MIKQFPFACSVVKSVFMAEMETEAPADFLYLTAPDQ
jgi:hypothetical protein